MLYTEWRYAFCLWQPGIVSLWALNPHVYDGYYKPAGWRSYVVLPRK